MIEIAQIRHRRFAPFAFSLHLPEQFLQTAGKSRNIAQRAGVALVLSESRIACKALAVACESNGPVYIIIRAIADQFRNAGRSNDAAAKT